MASGAGFGESSLGELSQALGGGGEDGFLVDQIIPHLQEPHLGIPAHPSDICFDNRVRSLLGIPPVAVEKERATRSASRQPLMSHSHGPGRTSSKSLIAKIRLRSADANRPKFIKCISPQAITSRSVRGEFARSPAMIAALPRKKANGEVNIRAIRTGTSSLIRVAFCLSRIVTGSIRSRALRNSAWEERGILRRSAFPFAIRSARDKRIAL